MSNLTGFAEACYNMNSIAELEQAFEEPNADASDLEEWGITPEEWFDAIEEALAAKRADRLGMEA